MMMMMMMKLCLASICSMNCYCVQLFKGSFFYCEGPDVSDITNKTDCINKGPPYRWLNRKYNFDNLGQVRVDYLVCAINE